MASRRSDMEGRIRSEVIRLRSEFRPLPVAFPHAHVDGILEALSESLRDQVADVLDGRILEERIPVLVIVLREDRPQGLLQVREVEEHAALVVALDEDVDLVRMAMQRSAPRVAREMVGAIDVFRDPEFHRGSTKGAAAIKVGVTPSDRRHGDEAEGPVSPLEELVVLVALDQDDGSGAERDLLAVEDQEPAALRHDELMVPLVAMRRGIPALPDDQLMQRGLSRSVL